MNENMKEIGHATNGNHILHLSIQYNNNNNNSNEKWPQSDLNGGGGGG